MTLNREVFLTDPTTFTIPNDGVTKVLTPTAPEEWEVLRYELECFVCEGEYRQGMDRILSTFLANLGKTEQPAVWVSGFYGSGKSHLVRVLEYLWRDMEFPDGATARGLAHLPPDIDALFRELTTVGRREGGLWSAAGTLSAGAGSVRLALLSIIFRSAGLPAQYAPAKFVIWLKQKGFYDTVVAEVENQGEEFDSELNNLYVSDVLAKSLLKAYPDLADTTRDARNLLKAQFPKEDEIDDDRLLQTIEDVLKLQSTTPGKLPATLLVFDELQQFIGDDSDRTLQVQTIVEACSSRFGSLLLFVGTGQAALEATPQLSKLQDRFTVRVTLSDRDVEHVVREVVLRKAQDKVADLKKILDAASGEIDRHLAGTNIASRGADVADLVPDYPLLPTRRRFWERVLRAIDRAGTAGQLRTQLRIVHEATKDVASKPIGIVVPGDVVYDQQKSAMLQSGVLLREVSVTIDDLRNSGTPEGELQARLCALSFLISQLPTEGVNAPGVRATADTLADLLVEDLPAGSAALRQQIPVALDDLVQVGTVMLVEGEYRLQTRESAEWEKDYRKRYARVAADDSRIASDRTTEFRTAINNAFKGLKFVQGASKTPRKFTPHFALDSPDTNIDAVPVWIRDEWSVTEKTVREDAQAAGVDSPIVFVLLPRQDADALKNALASHAAAKETLEARPAAQTTPEGMEARQAMQTRQQIERGRLDGLIQGILDNARVFQGGGSEVLDATLQDAVKNAIEAALVRLFPNFTIADSPGWGKVVKQAGEGATDALSAVGYAGDVEKHQACAEIRSFLGSGKKGSEIRKNFMGAGYGWPQDAVDGALLALMGGGFVRATKNSQPIRVKEIVQSQIGILEFYNEGVTVSAIQRIQVRKLIADLGLPVKNGEEAQAIPRVLQRLVDLGAEAGGAPPLPEPPSTVFIEDIQALAGNEQFVKVYEQREALLNSHTSWTKAKELKEERIPIWQELERLLTHASQLPVTKEVRPQFEAIKQDRTLLTTSNPVTPLKQQLTKALRSALQTAHQELVQKQAQELSALEASEEWQKIPETERQAILADHALTPITDLDVGTDKSLLETLDWRPLSVWESNIAALPSRIAQVRLAMAKILEPKTAYLTLTLPNATLHTTEDIDAYLAKLRKLLLEYIEAGNSVVT